MGVGGLSSSDVFEPRNMQDEEKEQEVEQSRNFVLSHTTSCHLGDRLLCTQWPHIL